MENYLNDMMANLKMDSFDVLNRFMLSPINNISDHLALAGGNSVSPLLAIESGGIIGNRTDSGHSKLQTITKPLKHILGHETVQADPTPTTESLETIRKVEEQQQEEIKQKIISSIEQKSSNRLYWSNMDEVKSSGIVNGMKTEEIHLQEGLFEIITSEASYNISLDILIDFFYKNDLLNPNKKDAVIDFVEKNNLFSNILLIKGVSFQFLKDLENRWSESKPKITDFADIILKHAGNEEFEQHYVNYLANQSFQITFLKKLMQKDSVRSVLQDIQNNPKCCKLSLDSFLALPMQRLTRLKLLLEVVLKLMNRSEELRNSIPLCVIKNHENALNKVKELLNKSEAKKFEMDQKARLMSLWNILDFGKVVNVGSNKLLIEDKVMAHIPQIYPNALKKLSKKRQPSFHLIVLSELVIIAKIKRCVLGVVLPVNRLIEHYLPITPRILLNIAQQSRKLHRISLAVFNENGYALRTIYLN